MGNVVMTRLIRQKSLVPPNPEDCLSLLLAQLVQGVLLSRILATRSRVPSRGIHADHDVLELLTWRSGDVEDVRTITLGMLSPLSPRCPQVDEVRLWCSKL